MSLFYRYINPYLTLAQQTMITLKTTLTSLFLCVLLKPSAADELSGASITCSDGSIITYYLEESRLETENKVLLLILQGSDCNSVSKMESIQNNLRKVWSDSDLLTIEKYGIGSELPYSLDAERPDSPVEYLLNDSPQQRANDVVNVLDYLNERNKYEHVILLGGS